MRAIAPSTPLTGRKYPTRERLSHNTCLHGNAESVSKLQQLLSGRKIGPSDTLGRHLCVSVISIHLFVSVSHLSISLCQCHIYLSLCVSVIFIYLFVSVSYLSVSLCQCHIYLSSQKNFISVIISTFVWMSFSQALIVRFSLWCSTISLWCFVKCGFIFGCCLIWYLSKLLLW